MSRKFTLIGSFRHLGVCWSIRTYVRNGKKGICYHPNKGHDPIFTTRPLTKKEITRICEERNRELV